MYSQCPECQTRFRVTADVLRIAQGTVRCGRCGSAFNALTRLSDSPNGTPRSMADTPADLASAASSLRNDQGNQGDDAAQPSEFHFSAEDIERVFVDARDWQRQFGTDPHGVAGFDAPAARPAGKTAAPNDSDDDDVEEPLVEVDENEGFEDITLEGERVVIEGLPDFLLDSSEHELTDAELLEAQAEARSRLLPDLEAGDEQPWAAGAGAAPDADESMLVDAARAESLAGDLPHKPDLDSTDRFEVLSHVPDSAYPEIQDDDAYDGPAARAAPNEAVLEGSRAPSIETDSRDSAPRAGEALPGVVAAAVAGHAPAQGAGRTAQSASMPSVVAIAAALSASPPAAPSSGDLRSSSRRPTRSAAPEGFGRIESPSVFEAEEFDDETPIGRRGAWLWGMGSLLLAIALVVQLAHVYRHELVRDPNVGPVLRNVYEQLGTPLSPNWDLAAYELRQWGPGETQPTGGVMTVRASIKNRAAFAQPLPLLRLELEDRFGGVIGRRDFESKEYLRDPAQASRLLAAGAATEAELELVDTTQEAVGYRLDICIQDTGAEVRCAQGKTR